jgi:hypothetical protein
MFMWRSGLLSRFCCHHLRPIRMNNSSLVESSKVFQSSRQGSGCYYSTKTSFWDNVKSDYNRLSAEAKTNLENEDSSSTWLLLTFCLLNGILFGYIKIRTIEKELAKTKAKFISTQVQNSDLQFQLYDDAHEIRNYEKLLLLSHSILAGKQIPTELHSLIPEEHQLEMKKEGSDLKKVVVEIIDKTIWK